MGPHLFILLVVPLFIKIASTNIEMENLWRENQFLKAEFRLAQKPRVYFVFNLPMEKVFIKARGVVLREFDAQLKNIWGDPVAIKPHVLLKKGSLFKPKRRSIEPGKGTLSADEFKLNALELDDMPSTYTLSMDDGISIYVRSRPNTILSSLWNIICSFYRSLYRPLVTILRAMHGKPYTTIDLILEKRDAQALYWSIMEGTESIIMVKR